jgi:hypothetical protein
LKLNAIKHLLRRRSKPVWPWEHRNLSSRRSPPSRTTWRRLNRLVNTKEEGIKIEYRQGGRGRPRSCKSNPRRRTARRQLKRLVIVIVREKIIVKEKIINRSRVNELKNLAFDGKLVVRLM